MKIAFLNVYQNKVERGAEVYVSELAKRLKKNNRVDIYSSDKRFPKRWPIIWRVYLDPQGILTALFTLSLITKLWREKYDIITPLNGGWQPAIIRILTWVHGGKLIISGQSGKGWDDKNNLWCFPDTFVALTKNSAEWAKNVNPFVRIKNIPNGVNIKQFMNKDKNLFKQMQKPVILTVGALEEEKRQSLLIKAMSNLKKGSLVIIGKGTKEKQLKNIGKKLLGDRFLLASYPHSKMPDVYNSADLFTYPTSPSESFGIVLIEAMAANLPIVATDDPIRREIVDNAGLFVDTENSNEYSTMLNKALNKKWGDKPLKQAENYSWDDIALRYEKLFSDLVN